MRISFRELEATFAAAEAVEKEEQHWEMTMMEKELAKLAQEAVLASQMTEFHPVTTQIPYLETPEGSESEEEMREGAEVLSEYFDRVIGDTMRSHKAKVSQLVEQERLRRQREAEEAERRRLEEERIRREKKEAEQRAREEQERIKLAEEKARLEAQEKTKREAEEAEKQRAAEKAKELAAIEAQRLKDEQEGTLFHKSECNSMFMKYKEEIARIKEEVLSPLKLDVNLKKNINAHKRKMNPKFGQLTNSQAQLTRITQELHELLLEGKVSELIYNWLLNFIAKALIAQAETEVSIKPKMAIPLAKLALNLLILHPGLEEFLMARFVKKCPLVIGYICAIDTEEGRSNMGWKRNSEGKYEGDSQYAERLSGIMTLFAVMNRLPLDNTMIGYDQNSMKHPFPMNLSWTLLARVVDAMPSLINDSHFTIIGAWWEACSLEFQQAYGQQAKKLLQLVSTKWVLFGKKGAARERLKMLGDDWRSGAQKSLPPMER